MRIEIAALANKKSELEDKIEKMVYKLENKMQPLDEILFWEMLVLLQQTLTNGKKVSEKNITNDIKRQMHNFICEFRSTYDNKDMYLIALLRFLKTYDLKVAALYNALDSVVRGCGDDGFGDTLDSFPLWGQKRYAAALKGHPFTKRADEDGSNNYTKIYLGENYISMILRDEILKRSEDFDTKKDPELKTYEVEVTRTQTSTEKFNVTVEHGDQVDAAALSEANGYNYEEGRLNDYKVTKVTRYP